MNFLKKYIVASIIVLSPLSAFAEKISAQDMKTTCVESFMKQADKASDADAYKNYVNKMCECSGNKVEGKDLDQSTTMAIMGSCMQITMLTESMSALKDDTALTADKITAACMKQWQVFTSPNKTNQGTQQASCACAAAEIMALDQDKRTDEGTLEQIAMKCAVKTNG